MNIKNPRREILVCLILVISSIVGIFYLIPYHIKPWVKSRYQMVPDAFFKLQNEALTAREEGRNEDAEPLLLQLRNDAISIWGDEGIKVAEISYYLGAIYDGLEKYDLARQYFNQSVDISSKQYKLKPKMEEVQILLRISATSWKHGEYDNAIEYAKRTMGAVEALRSKYGNLLPLDIDDIVENALYIMADTYEAQQDQLREKEMRKRIVTINKELVRKAELNLLTSLQHYAYLLLNMKKDNELKDVEQQSKSILGKYKDDTGEEFQEMLKLYFPAPEPTEKNKKEQQMPQ